MGSVISRAKLIIGAVYILNQALDKVSKRLKESPGLPVANPSLPFWTVPKSPIAAIQQPLPAQADIVVIGSGITGASFAYNALSKDDSVRVLILEAREVCSGATGRNGGHINPPLWGDWKRLKEEHGEKDARTMIYFRLAHVHELLAIAAQEDILKESQVRETEHLEVYFAEDDFAEACEELEAWKADMPEVAKDYVAYAGAVAQEKFGLSDRAVGCIVGPGGAIHPYRFVTNLLSKLLDRYPDRFSIAAYTPCTSIQPATPETPNYTVRTPRGAVHTPHIVHATNGWVSHLATPMREKVVPVRGTMSAQRPGTALAAATRGGARSYVFYPGGLGYDYLTQLPGAAGELMFGGGWASAPDGALRDLGAADDSAFSVPVAAHLAGALPLYFARWGREADVRGEPGAGAGVEGEGAPWGEGRTKAQWGGILGISADGLPWVGRLPAQLAGRPAPPAGAAPRVYSKARDAHRAATAAPGEWIAAGYTGEGMVHAWLSGKALASMVLGREDETRAWFPAMLRPTVRRWRDASLESFLARRIGQS